MIVFCCGFAAFFMLTIYRENEFLFEFLFQFLEINFKLPLILPFSVRFSKFQKMQGLFHHPDRNHRSFRQAVRRSMMNYSIQSLQSAEQRTLFALNDRKCLISYGLLYPNTLKRANHHLWESNREFRSLKCRTKCCLHIAFFARICLLRSVEPDGSVILYLPSCSGNTRRGGFFEFSATTFIVSIILPEIKKPSISLILIRRFYLPFIYFLTLKQ